MNEFIKKEMRILEEYDFSFFDGKYIPNENWKWQSILVLVYSIFLFYFFYECGMNFIFFLLFIVLIIVFMYFMFFVDGITRHILINEIKKMRISEHLIMKEDEIPECRDLSKIFNERRDELLTQYKKGEIDPEILKKLYFKEDK